ncbi:MAG: hypothetical protein J6I49_02885 [Bacteroidales bacterium]|nr:hypothetical protein [Bacteroidales bacterium]
MKKTFKMLALVAMGAALAMTACGKDDDDKNDNPTGGGNGGGSGTESAEWVDLGLPSGLLWATCNVGASASEEPGDYYAWGETATKSEYNWSTYKYCTVDEDDNLKTLTKYNTDGLTTLQASDDVATAKLGSGARIPTADEWRELINNTTAEWTTVNGVNGRKFTAANGNSLFLPTAGRRWDDDLDYEGEDGLYWSSSLDASRPDGAWYFSFGSGYQNIDIDYRGGGISVRAVRQK